MTKGKKVSAEDTFFKIAVLLFHNNSIRTEFDKLII